MTESKTILLTGATGYVGGRLLGRFEASGRRVRCLARNPAFLTPRVGPNTEVVAGDAFDRKSLEAALQGVDTAFYLIHSMGSTGAFETEDRSAAENFAAAARTAGVRRIVYLGGLGDRREVTSAHLRSRHEVGDILRAGGVGVIELRASIVIGTGSLSFEMIRALVERLPIMITPKWVSVEAQPIAIADLLDYLEQSIDLPGSDSRTFEIGGRDRVSYGDLMREYARQRGLRRWMIRVPVLTPRLSSLWLGLVTPLYARVGRKLVDSICHPTVVIDDAALAAFAVRPRGMAEAIGDALAREDGALASPSWFDAMSSAGPAPAWGGVRFGSRLVDQREVWVPVEPARAFAPARRIGGKRGWYYAQFLWKIRGYVDLLIGGVGMRRGRRDPESLVVGDVVDWWRVEVFEPDRRLVLFAEMRLPGRAWLEFSVEARDGGAVLRQRAVFDPVGVGGLLYWYGIYPLHQVVFAGMLREMARAAVEDDYAAQGAEPSRRRRDEP
jgi:uncharacterized protein YbjT (DUF2867 family)